VIAKFIQQKFFSVKRFLKKQAKPILDTNLFILYDKSKISFMFSGKKLLLLGFIIVLLVAIPVTVFLINQQQQTQSKAAPATILSIVDSTTSSPNKTMKIGESATFKVIVNPGTNQVSFSKFTLTYDPTKLEVVSGDFKPNSVNFPSILQGPTYGSGTVSITMSIGGALDKVIQTPKDAGTLTVKAIGGTAGATTKIDFGTPQVLSVGSTDTFNENVFSSANPAIITINDEATTTTTSSTTSTTTTTTPATTTTTVPTGTPSANQIPSCSSLALNGAASGTAPYSLTFTANGNDTDGTISKATFNFGDGQVLDVTEGTGTGSVSIQQSHTYASSGTFTATAIFTDNSGGVSTASSCTQSITITGGVTTTTLAVSTPTPTMVPTGPGNAMMTIGAIGGILSVVGILLFLAL
jgi:hypothetical protein